MDVNKPDARTPFPRELMDKIEAMDFREFGRYCVRCFWSMIKNLDEMDAGPVIFVQHRDGIGVLITDRADRPGAADRAARDLRKVIDAKDGVRIGVVNLAWAAPKDEGRPRDNPDRFEVVSCLVETPEQAMLYVQRTIREFGDLTGFDNTIHEVPAHVGLTFKNIWGNVYMGEPLH